MSCLKFRKSETHIVRSLNMVITPKHVAALLMYILILLLNQFSCTFVGDKTLIISRWTVRLWKLCIACLLILLFYKTLFCNVDQLNYRLPLQYNIGSTELSVGSAV